jgi:hypothetical protein
MTSWRDRANAERASILFKSDVVCRYEKLGSSPLRCSPARLRLWHDKALRLGRLRQTLRLLTNPAAQDLIAQQIASLAGTVLDTKIGPLAALTDPHDHGRPDDTFYSVEQLRDPKFDRH